MNQQFITVWKGKLTLNLQQLVGVRWRNRDNEAGVYASDGREYVLKGEDCQTLKNILGRGASN